MPGLCFVGKGPAGRLVESAHLLFEVSSFPLGEAEGFIQTPMNFWDPPQDRAGQTRPERPA